MNRLTEEAQYPIGGDTFCRCQLCGHESDDICEFKFWQECDEKNDKPEPYNILITCKGDACLLKIEAHERLYRELCWGSGQPGHLSLLCGKCTYREGTRCTHPDLKANGGTGLDLVVGNFLGNAVFCCHNPDDKTGFGMTCHRFTPPFTHCAGLPLDHLRRWKGDSG